MHVPAHVTVASSFHGEAPPLRLSRTRLRRLPCCDALRHLHLLLRRGHIRQCRGLSCHLHLLLRRGHSPQRTSGTRRPGGPRLWSVDDIVQLLLRQRSQAAHDVSRAKPPIERLGRAQYGARAP